MIRFENVSLRYGSASHPADRPHLANQLGRWNPFNRPSRTGQASALQSGHQPEVFKSLNLSFDRGSFHFITGVSGAGKSSLLKLINLALRPTTGKIHVAGQDTSLLDSDELARMRRRIGFVFQDYRLLDHLSVEDNVALPLKIAGVYDGKRRNDVLDLLTWVGLGDKLIAAPRTLSGGQKQRVALARAVITRPQLLLADEPTGNLDDGMGLRLVKLFQELNRIGTTVLIATHNRELLSAFPFPVINLAGGTATVERKPLNVFDTKQTKDPVFAQSAFGDL